MKKFFRLLFDILNIMMYNINRLTKKEKKYEEYEKKEY